MLSCVWEGHNTCVQFLLVTLMKALGTEACVNEGL